MTKKRGSALTKATPVEVVAEVVAPEVFDTPMIVTCDEGSPVFVANGGRLIFEHRDGVLHLSLGYGREVRSIGEASPLYSPGGEMVIRMRIGRPIKIEMEDPR